MKLKELAESLGVTNYPEKLEKIYLSLGEDDGSIYNREYIIGLQEKYNLLGQYLDVVLSGADEIKTKPNLLLWARLGCAYVNQTDCYESGKFPIPVSDGSLAMDMLPVLGVGTVLVPWALVAFFQRNFYLGFGLTVLYLVMLILRQIAEPKLLGKSLGLHPLLTLFAGYAGFRLFGFFGMLAGPVVATLVKNALPSIRFFMTGEEMSKTREK